MTHFDQQRRSNFLLEAQTSLKAAMPSDVVIRAERLAAINDVYISTGRDPELAGAIDMLVDSAATSSTPESNKLRILFVIGESGSGKSMTIRKHLRDRNEFQPRMVHGQEIKPMVSFDAPKPSTLKSFCRAAIQAIGYPVYGSMSEAAYIELFKQQLVERRVLFLHIDEMQHVIKNSKPAVIQEIADTVKSILQIDGWPMHLILSGVPSLARFLQGDNQIVNRKMVVRFEQILFPRDAELVRTVAHGIVRDDAQMAMNDLSDEAVHRIIHAANGAFGTIIQFVRATVGMVMRQNEDAINSESFARTYTAFSGCLPGQNVFLVKNFKDVEPANALADLLDKYNDSAKMASTGTQK